MSNKEKYIGVFVSVFDVSPKDVESMKYQEAAEWDSVGHMNLIARLEDEFDIMFDTDDIVAFESYTEGIEILKRYDVEL